MVIYSYDGGHIMNGVPQLSPVTVYLTERNHTVAVTVGHKQAGEFHAVCDDLGINTVGPDPLAVLWLIRLNIRGGKRARK